MSGSAGDGLALLGGSANVTFSGLLAGNQGHDLNISNIGGGTIDMTKAQFGGSGSQGILLQDDAGTINFNNLSVSNTAGRGIDIEGESGTVQFAGTTTVSGATGTSVNVESLLSPGTVTFADLAINNRQGADWRSTMRAAQSPSTERRTLPTKAAPRRRLFRSPIRPERSHSTAP